MGNTSGTSYNRAQGDITGNPSQHYRAEFNPLSSRWMVLDSLNVCKAAGLSHSKANQLVLELSQKH